MFSCENKKGTYYTYYVYCIDDSQISLLSDINLLKGDFELIHWCNDIVFILPLLTLLKCSIMWLYESFSPHVFYENNRK
jgi:hypothetical protein